MEVRVINVKIPRKHKRLHLEPLGDLHIGSPAFDKQKFLERVKAIARDPDRYTIIMGDIIDNVRPYRRGVVDKRFTFHGVDRSVMTPTEQIRLFHDYVNPIKHKILGVLWGNHEFTTMEYDEFRETVCRLPDGTVLPFLGSMCFLRLVVSNGAMTRSWNVWACHGSYGGMKRGGAINRLEDLSLQYDADVYLHAHTHLKEFSVASAWTITPDGGLDEWRRIYVLTGTFMRKHVVGFDSYSEKRPSLLQSRVGTITVVFDLETGKTHAIE
ncbi:MAG: metallophosphoesterase [Candidatus Caldarchaeum sp.]